MGQLEDMQVFVRVVEAGGIGRAAEQLEMAKSAVSRRISELEKHLGVRLINRTTRTSSLSDVGQHYYDRALMLLDDVAELNAMTSDATCALAGSIHLAAPLSFGLNHLSTAIGAFLKLHPEVEINVDFSDRQIDLVEEGLDLAFRIADLADSSLIARNICPIKRILCASPGYLKTHGSPSSINDLKSHALLHYNVSPSSTWKLNDRQGKQHTIRTCAKIIANNGDFLMEMAISDHGIIAMPTFISWKAIAAGDLVHIMPDYTLLQLNAYVVYPQSRYLSQRARALIEFLVERFGENPYWDQHISV